MLTLSRHRPFDKKINFPMAVIPFLNAVEDIASPASWQDYRHALKSVPEKKLAGTMYVHVPFCKTLCTHCTYDRVLYDPDEEKQYLRRLMEEIDCYSEQPLVRSVAFTAVHLGGGTPNALSAEGLTAIMKAVKSGFRLQSDAVVNVEVGTKAYLPDKIALLKELGCNRISFGVQSFNSEVRKKCALTTPKDTLYQMAEQLRHLGYDINFDLMYGLPGQNLAVWRQDLEEAMTFNPACLDVYCYYPVHSRLYTACKRGNAMLPDQATVLQTIETTIAFLDERGYRQETAEDFVKPGKLPVMKEFGYGKNDLSDDYLHLALGPNAMGVVRSYLYRNKFYNFPRTKNYLSASRTGSPLPLFLLKQVEATAQRNLAMFPRTIRMKKSRIGDALLERFAGRLTAFEQKGLITSDGDYLALTDLGRLWIDNLSYELMDDHVRANFGNAVFSYPQE